MQYVVAVTLAECAHSRSKMFVLLRICTAYGLHRCTGSIRTTIHSVNS